MLCHKCTGIDFRFYDDCSIELQEAVGNVYHHRDLFYLHSVDAACLERTAHSGCQFCKTIQHRLAIEDLWTKERAISCDQIILRIYEEHFRGSGFWDNYAMDVLCRKGVMR
jgi:hypothetical protein